MGMEVGRWMKTHNNSSVEKKRTGMLKWWQAKIDNSREEKN